MSMLLAPALDGIAERPDRKPLLATLWRYGVSTSGPVAISGAHFLAALLFVRDLSTVDFGLFSFALVIVPFAMSVSSALLIIPVTRSLDDTPAGRAAVIANCLKMNLVYSAAVALVVAGLLFAAHAKAGPALLMGLFGGALTYRWFGRCFAYVEGRVGVAVACDLLYAVTLVVGLGILALGHRVSLAHGALMLLLAALFSLAPLGRSFLAQQYAAMSAGRLVAYGAIFRDLTRWSLLGVVFTEMTVNAHAYLVTFVSGPAPFALLALGMLLMRPISLVQSALPDLERPTMTRQIAVRDWKGLARSTRLFGGGLWTIWLLTLALDAALLIWFPALVLKKGYALSDIVIVAAISATIMAVRCLRGPLALQLQAAGAFKEMAGIGTKSSVISIVATLGLLLVFGPIASLGGILIGEMVILFYCFRLVAAWKEHHG